MESIYKVGDRVRYLRGARRELVGHIATVVDARNSEYVVIQFDEKFAFCDTQRGLCKPNRGWSLSDHNIELVDPAPSTVEINFSFDDLIGGAHNA